MILFLVLLPQKAVVMVQKRLVVLELLAQVVVLVAVLVEVERHLVVLEILDKVMLEVVV
jgi:hypothetical protein